MKYRGKLENLFKLGYHYNESLQCYEKELNKSFVIIFPESKRIDYQGKESTILLEELGVLK